MILDATYSTKDRGTTIGKDEAYTEKSWNPLLHLIGRGKKVRTRTNSEAITLDRASQVLDSLIEEDGLLIVDLSDGESSCDFKPYGDDTQFFIEQYFDLIYGGVYDRSTVQRIMEEIFSGCTSEELRDLFPTLPGELVYDYKAAKTNGHKQRSAKKFMRSILSLLGGTFTLVYGLMIPFALFFVRSHDWTIAGSSFLGSMVFALLWVPTALVGAGLFITLPKWIFRRRSVSIAKYQWMAWPALGLFIGASTAYPEASMVLGAAAGLLAALVDLRIDPPVGHADSKQPAEQGVGGQPATPPRVGD